MLGKPNQQEILANGSLPCASYCAVGLHSLEA
jgi:hypothetical protein